jgi:hypothetical protein
MNEMVFEKKIVATPLQVIYSYMDNSSKDNFTSFGCSGVSMLGAGGQ